MIFILKLFGFIFDSFSFFLLFTFCTFKYSARKVSTTRKRSGTAPRRAAFVSKGPKSFFCSRPPSMAVCFNEMTIFARSCARKEPTTPCLVNVSIIDVRNSFIVNCFLGRPVDGVLPVSSSTSSSGKKMRFFFIVLVPGEGAEEEALGVF